ncbi:hypothetical protein GSI_11173 [Ganoderma sinense ZZ0214-1]|uniref:CFEM domain-containing protein n=1 Tax=Ganoderma sinense ZZ0214-1 TaxID=1077348 RepID=A0A2G8RZM6_9APHY|nr:hypothetical protein GSI_11173 [Ganoderma sinense ZZ0214-1]
MHTHPEDGPGVDFKLWTVPSTAHRMLYARHVLHLAPQACGRKLPSTTFDPSVAEDLCALSRRASPLLARPPVFHMSWSGPMWADATIRPEMQFTLLSIALAALLGGASAQLSPCLQGCLTAAESQAGCGALDIRCMCTSSAFQADMLACVKAKCTAQDLADAKKFEAEFCGTCAGADWCRWYSLSGVRVGASPIAS